MSLSVVEGGKMARKLILMLAMPMSLAMALLQVMFISALAANAGSVTGLYEGNIHLEGLALQIYDGKDRHYIYVNGGTTPPALQGKIGYTIRVEYRDEKLDPKEAEILFGDKDTSLRFMQSVTLVSGKDNPELCKVRGLAEAEDSKAKNTLGVWYEKGKQGLPKDPAEAVRWYEMAAVDEPLAMHNLGDCYLDGVGVEKDEAKAIEWYNKAIEAGNPIGYEDLGDLYLKKGQRDKARAMYHKAADAGRKSARKKLAEMGQ